MPSPESERRDPTPAKLAGTTVPTLKAAPTSPPSSTSSVAGLWLFVDALAILGIAGGIAAWYLIGNRTAWIVAECVAGTLCVAAAGLAGYIRSRPKVSVRDVSPSASVGPRAAARPGTTQARPNSIDIGGEAIENLRALHKVIARVCCQHADGSGKVDGNASRAFFAQLDVATVEPLLRATEPRTANEFQRLLDRIASGVGAPVSPQLDQVRSAIPQCLEPTLKQLAEDLATTSDLQAFRETLTDCCFEHSDGRGWNVTWGLGTLLSRVTPEQLSAIFEPARPKALAGVARIVAALSRHLTTPCAQLEVVRAALIDAGRAKLPVSRQVDWLIPFITGLCCEHADGGGKVDREAARRLFDGLSFARMGDRLSHVPIRELNDVAHSLSRIAAGLEEPQPAGFRGLLKAIDESIELAAIHLQPTLLAADSLPAMRQVLADACCECDDGSGFHNRRALHAMFEGVVAERFVPQVESATPAERLQMSQLVTRIDMDRRGEALSPEVQRFRDLLTAAVERDRAAQRASIAEPTPSLHDQPSADQILETSDGIVLTWQHFKHANLTSCSPELSQQFGQLLDQIAQDGEEGLRRIVRRLWKGFRREGDRLAVDFSDGELSHEWARKRFLAEALARGGDRRTVPKLIALLEGQCDDPEYQNSVQPAIAKALIAMRDKRAVAALRQVKHAAHVSPATRRVIAASKHASASPRLPGESGGNGPAERD